MTGLVPAMYRQGRPPYAGNRHQSFLDPTHPLGAVVRNLSKRYFTASVGSRKAVDFGVPCVDIIDGSNWTKGFENKGYLRGMRGADWDAFWEAFVESVLSKHVFYLSIHAQFVLPSEDDPSSSDGFYVLPFILDLDFKSTVRIDDETMKLYAAEIAKVFAGLCEDDTPEELLFTSMSMVRKEHSRNESGLIPQGGHMCWYNHMVTDKQATALVLAIKNEMSNVARHSATLRRSPNSTWKDTIDEQADTHLRPVFSGKAKKCGECRGKAEDMKWCHRCKGLGKLLDPDNVYRMRWVFDGKGEERYDEWNQATPQFYSEQMRRALPSPLAMLSADQRREAKKRAIMTEIRMTSVNCPNDPNPTPANKITIELAAPRPSLTGRMTGPRTGRPNKAGTRKSTNPELTAKQLRHAFITSNPKAITHIPVGSEESDVLQTLINAAMGVKLPITSITLMHKATRDGPAEPLAVRIDVNNMMPDGRQLPCINHMHPTTSDPAPHNSAVVFFHISGCADMERPFELKIWCDCTCDKTSNRFRGKCTNGPFSLNTHPQINFKMALWLFDIPAKEQQQLASRVILGPTSVLSSFGVTTTSTPMMYASMRSAHNAQYLTILKRYNEICGISTRADQTYSVDGGYSTAMTQLIMGLRSSTGVPSAEVTQRQYDKAMEDADRINARSSEILLCETAEEQARLGQELRTQLADARRRAREAGKAATPSPSVAPSRHISVSDTGVVSGSGIEMIMQRQGLL